MIGLAISVPLVAIQSRPRIGYGDPDPKLVSSTAMRLRIISSLILLLAVSAEEDKVSECLKKCILPLASLERSFKYVFNNFEKACDLLEAGAYCAKKCDKDDQNKYHQYTTFYRIHCIDYEEDLEPHLECLKTAAKDIDDVCTDRCKTEHKLEKTASKEQKQKASCLSLECSTVCYFQEFVADCPEAEQTLLRINIGQVHSIANSIHPLSFERMDQECRNIHNTDHMRRKMLGRDEH